jgi:preprotein translocase subunit SecD
MWRGVLILTVAVLAILSAHPLNESINLGLDLRGGIHLVLEVQTEDAVKSESEKDLSRLLQEIQEKGIEGVTGAQLSASSFAIENYPADRDAEVAEIVGDYLPGWSWDRQADVLAFDMEFQNVTTIKNLAVEQALETIRNRIDAFGVAEPVIQRQGLEGKRIVVQLPGVDDPERVKKLIKNTAFLEFRIVDYPPSGGGVPTRGDVLAHYGGQIPSDVELLAGSIRNDLGDAVGEQFYAVEKKRVITGRELKTARPGLGEFNQPIINFYLTHEGGVLFGNATGENIGRGLAIILDGRVVSAPSINSRITDAGIIEGSFTQQQAEDLSTVLRSGALPAGITYLEERTVGPSLGQDSIRKGLRAGKLGLVLVVIAILLVYLGSGINAVLALGLNIIFIFGALAYFGATLTLPGMAGIVLTIGMAVDANVLVFERIREELRHGRTVKSAVEAGFGKALSSVIDANLTTLIAALFLFQFGTGPIRGFAVTLSIGILASMFTALFVSRWIFDLLLSRRQKIDRLSI